MRSCYDCRAQVTFAPLGEWPNGKTKWSQPLEIDSEEVEEWADGYTVIRTLRFHRCQKRDEREAKEKAELDKARETRHRKTEEQRAADAKAFAIMETPEEQYERAKKRQCRKCGAAAGAPCRNLLEPEKDKRSPHEERLRA